MLRTTVVGSYPIPDWLAVLPSEQTLEDAMAVVLKTQEKAGIDLVADGLATAAHMRKGRPLLGQADRARQLDALARRERSNGKIGLDRSTALFG